MDYTGVPAPSNYGAPQVFGQQQGQQQPQGGQGAQQKDMGSQIGSMLQKAKTLMGQGLISPNQYNQLELQYSGGNMGSSMGAGAPLNLAPG